MSERPDPKPRPTLVLDIPTLLAKEQQLWRRLSHTHEELLDAIVAQLDGELGPFRLAAAREHERVLARYTNVLQQLHSEFWNGRPHDDGRG